MDPTLDSIEQALDNIDFITYVKFRKPLHRRKVAERILTELRKTGSVPEKPQEPKKSKGMGSPGLLHERMKEQNGSY